MKNCRGCHFLAKEHREEQSGRALSWSLTSNERDELLLDVDSIPEHYSLKCHMGVWDEGAAPLKSNRIRIIRDEERDNCFHYPYQSGMMFKAAEELQRRQQENFQLKRSNLYTRIGLWLAAFGLVLSAIASLVGD